MVPTTTFILYGVTVYLSLVGGVGAAFSIDSLDLVFSSLGALFIPFFQSLLEPKLPLSLCSYFFTSLVHSLTLRAYPIYSSTLPLQLRFGIIVNKLLINTSSII